MAINIWPPLTHRWYSGKDIDGDFSLEEFEKIYAGNTLLETGHFIVDLFSKDRSGVSDVNNLDVETTQSRFSTVTTFAGRVWYSGVDDATYADKVFFTRVVRNENDLGVLYQEADPTSEEFSDLIDTDGGEITISGARGIKVLFPYGSDLLVLAENGVWQIKGIDAVFKPSAYAIIKVSDQGILSPDTLVDVDGTPIWWGQDGIYTMSRSEVTEKGSVENISLSTIQTFWDNIPSLGKLNAKAIYDKKNKRIYWLYSTVGEDRPYKYNKILILDIPLGAFYPWSISEHPTGRYYISGGFYYEANNASINDEELVTVDDVTVTVSSVDVVISDFVVYSTLTTPQIKFLVTDDTNNSLTFGQINGTDFLDWGTENYNSYIIAGYDFLSGGATLKKNSPYITTFFGVTEDGFESNGNNGYDLVDPSSCLLSARWDFKSGFSTPRQVYRFKRNLVVDESNLSSFDSGYTVVATRNKIRGRGKAVILKFESEEGKDFNLLGYEIFGATNQGF